MTSPELSLVRHWARCGIVFHAIHPKPLMAAHLSHHEIHSMLQGYKG